MTRNTSAPKKATRGRPPGGRKLKAISFRPSESNMAILNANRELGIPYAFVIERAIDQYVPAKGGKR